MDELACSLCIFEEYIAQVASKSEIIPLKSLPVKVPYLLHVLIDFLSRFPLLCAVCGVMYTK